MLIDDSNLANLLQSVSKTINRVDRYMGYQFAALENDLKQVKENQQKIIEKLKKLLDEQKKN